MNRNIVYTRKLDDIEELPIADGLKQTLIISGFTIQTILKTQLDIVATKLGVDLYIAKIIYLAAKGKNDHEYSHS